MGPGEEGFAHIARQITERHLLERLAEQHLSHSVPLPRLLLLMNFWGQFYLTAKYGFEVEHLASAQELFRMGEAKLAVEHADECYRAASILRHHDKDKVAMLSRIPAVQQQALVSGPASPAAQPDRWPPA